MILAVIILVVIGIIANALRVYFHRKWKAQVSFYEEKVGQCNDTISNDRARALIWSLVRSQSLISRVKIVDRPIDSAHAHTLVVKEDGVPEIKFVIPDKEIVTAILMHEIGHGKDISRRIKAGGLPYTEFFEKNLFLHRLWVALGIEYMIEKRAWDISRQDTELRGYSLMTYRYQWAACLADTIETVSFFLAFIALMGWIIA